jgi:hypothetical protein
MKKARINVVRIVVRKTLRHTQPTGEEAEEGARARSELRHMVTEKCSNLRNMLNVHCITECEARNTTYITQTRVLKA